MRKVVGCRFMPPSMQNAVGLLHMDRACGHREGNKKDRLDPWQAGARKSGSGRTKSVRGARLSRRQHRHAHARRSGGEPRHNAVTEATNHNASRGQGWGCYIGRPKR